MEYRFSAITASTGRENIEWIWHQFHLSCFCGSSKQKLVRTKISHLLRCMSEDKTFHWGQSVSKHKVDIIHLYGPNTSIKFSKKKIWETFTRAKVNSWFSVSNLDRWFLSGNLNWKSSRHFLETSNQNNDIFCFFYHWLLWTDHGEFHWSLHDRTELFDVDLLSWK